MPNANYPEGLANMLTALPLRDRFQINVIFVDGDARGVDSAAFPLDTPDADVVAAAEHLAASYPDCRVSVRRGPRHWFSIEVEDWGVAPVAALHPAA